MKQVIVIKLEPSQEQYPALLKTVQAFNLGCQYAADVAYEKRLANKIALQPFVYGHLRSEFGLSSQMAIRAIAKAVEAYKRDRRIHVKFDVHGAMVYDPRIMSFKGLTQVSLVCLDGRELVPMRYGAYQAATARTVPCIIRANRSGSATRCAQPFSERKRRTGSQSGGVTGR